MDEREKAFLLQQGTQVLVGAFGAVFAEMFKSDYQGFRENNQYARMEKPEQLVLIQNALALSLAQTTAAASKRLGIPKEVMLKQVVDRLSAHFDTYSEMFSKETDNVSNETAPVDKGPESGPDDSRDVPDRGDDGRND